MAENVNLQTTTPPVITTSSVKPDYPQKYKIAFIIFLLFFVSVLIVIGFYSLRIYIDQKAFENTSLAKEQKVRIIFGNILESKKISLVAEVASNQDDKQLGLSRKNALNESMGFLTLCNTSAKCKFWMKGIKFPVDIIWLKGNQIVDIKTDIPVSEPDQPDDALIIYSPSKEADKALVVAAGFSKRRNINIGDKISQF